ncbi:ABC transporter permease [Nocardioides humi]|uniref:ABC transporter permease n=1 Tax=Nocardioides humi TaxID=449461 RepID=A0ABN2BFB2_9ACTN|nr:ABC transporter permease [Nocardioides humi]
MLPVVEQPPPAGGAALDQVLIAAAAFAVIYVPLGIFLLREREGRPTVIGRLADRVAAVDGMPRWAGLPSYLAVIALVTAGFGVYWDVPIHMQNGRDEGPLANPSHYPIMLGIFGFLAAGVISAGLAKDPLPRRTVRLTPRWRVPMGSMVLLGAGLIAAAGFPADDVWHRLFGQDVTEWGPTHVMMIGGAVTCVFAVPLLYAEAAQVGRPPAARWAWLGALATGGLRAFGRILPPVRREVPPDALADRGAWATRTFLTIAVGGCIIPVAFLMEFDLGVPQFPAATLFVISGFLTAWIFLTCRLFFGPGGALVGWLTYTGIRGVIFLVTLPIPDIHRAHWLLFLGAAVCIELLALVVSSRGPVFAALAGLLAGTVGLATEWWWMELFLPYPLPPERQQMPFLLAVGGLAAIGGGLLAWSFARNLERIADLPRAAAPTRAEAAAGRWLGTTGTLVFVVLMGIFAPPASAGEVEVVRDCEDDVCRTTYEPVAGTDVIMGHVSYAEDCIGEERCASVVTVRLDPVDAADDAVWIAALAYQGKHENDPAIPGDGVLSIAMAPTGRAGEYRSTDPLPLYGSWKTLVRLHRAPTTMVSIPLHMPEDAAIEGPAAGLVQVDDGTDVAFVHEPFLLQRERKPEVPVWLWSVMYGVVIASWLGLLAFYGWLYAAAGRERGDVPATTGS